MRSQYTIPRLVDRAGFKPALSGCKPDVLSLTLTAHFDNGRTTTRHGYTEPMAYCMPPTVKLGAGNRNRTCALTLTGRLLFHLSYTGKSGGECRNRTRVCRVLRHLLAFRASALPLGQLSKKNKGYPLAASSLFDVTIARPLTCTRPPMALRLMSGLT